MVLVPDEVSQPALPAEKQWFFDLADRAADHVAMRDMSLTILHFRLHHKNRFQFARVRHHAAFSRPLPATDRLLGYALCADLSGEFSPPCLARRSIEPAGRRHGGLHTGLPV
ncbi:hypothetical protein LH447_01080 [Laribacter hongkongensis]|uniref:hypothetical protein n=1 Tax=Laribacter hongkongensis TaxID=168471 RepID=UPI001EFE22CE|nr:hypothetical protein [Laribacter hongkongensis]MCG9051702.1 hypothetical protein [Laribacter hongkongensis]